MKILRPHLRHWGNSRIRLGNLYLRHSRQFGCKSKFENYPLHVSHHHLWFILRKLNLHHLAEVPWNRVQPQTEKPGLMADWLARWNLCKPFQNMESWAPKHCDVDVGNQSCWSAEKYRVFLLFPFSWILFWPLGNVPLRQAWKYQPLCVNELFILLIIR